MSITQEKGLEVVLPWFGRNINVPQFIEDKRAWIEGNLLKHSETFKQANIKPVLPIKIDFIAIWLARLLE